MPPALPSSKPLNRAAGFLGACGILLIGVVTVMQALPPAAKTGAADSSRPCTLRPDGFLRGRFFGALSLAADWSGADLICDGMQRPDGEGVRLFFASGRPGGGRISVLIGIDGRPERLIGEERPANVTVIDERSGRFFAASGPGRCWASIDSVTSLSHDLPPPAGYRIAGLVYCVGALPSVGDRSSVTIGDLHFAGRVTSDEA
jgi:hypothetical protein